MVCAPLACTCVASAFREVMPPGAVCTLTPYPFERIQKFVFDGSEKFMDIPPAFFHYSACISTDKLLCDLQGHCDEDGSFVFIDPVVLDFHRSQDPCNQTVNGYLPLCTPRECSDSR